MEKYIDSYQTTLRNDSELKEVCIYDIVTTWVTEGTMLSNQVSPIT